MSNIRVGATRRRGDYVVTDVHDITRVTDPLTARIYQWRGEYLVIPENDLLPCRQFTDLSGAMDFIERYIPDESGMFSPRAFG